jgi:membrane-anchored protein YejM (alkaline phosphatase superfamily)
MFSLFYSLPPTYKSSAVNEKTSPAFLAQLNATKMELSFYKSANDTTSLDYLGEREFRTLDMIATDFKEKREADEIEPFMMYVSLREGNIVEKDEQVRNILDQMYVNKLHRDTIIVITGSHGETRNQDYLVAQELQTPLLVMWPGRSPKVVSTMTSHYDIIPTIVKENWKCKNPMDEYSFGKSLFNPDEVKTFVAGTYQKLGIVDLPKQKVLTIENDRELKVYDFNAQEAPRDPEETKLVLDTLSEMTTFYQRQ